MIYSGNDKTALGEQLERLTPSDLSELKQARKLEAFRAACQGSLYSLRGFLDDGDIDVNETWPGSQDTLLMASMDSWNVDKVNYLLDHGARIDDRNIDGRTALMRAASIGAVSMVRELLKRGARLDVIDDKGKTVLMHAAYSGFPMVVSVLLEHGADPSDVSHCGCAVSDHALRGKQSFDELLAKEEERLANGGDDPELYVFLRSHEGPNHGWVLRMLKQRMKVLKKSA